MSPLDPRALRTAFGRFMTGVTIVTAQRPDGTPVGFTANSFSSVSLDPPLLLVCPGKFLSSYDVFASCTHFAVNILAEGQEEVSNTFASFKGDRFAQIAHKPDLNGVPLIDGAVAQFSCTTVQTIPAGDHCVLIGQVTDFEQQDLPGLGYVQGRYFSLGLERAAFEDAKTGAICGVLIEDAGHVLLEQTPQGFRPPQSIQSDRRLMLSGLRDMLAARGIMAELGQAYSVFDDPDSRQHHSYFLASGIVTDASGLRAIPLQDLATLPYTTPAIAQMMTRYAQEARTRSFALYIGGTEHGDLHRLLERI